MSMAKMGYRRLNFAILQDIKHMKKQRTFRCDAHPVLQYIEEHGFGIPTPDLTRTLSAEEFKQHYYDKKELIDFCRSFGISTGGQKNDLNSRVELFLRTGQVTVVTPSKRSVKPDSATGLSLDKVVSNYKSDPVTRNFFEKNCPGFIGFSALVQKQIRERLAEGDTFTYGDAIEMHKNYLQNKFAAREAGQASRVVHDSCQYNQFTIDYNHDDQPKLHTAMEAWMLVRNTAGEKTYERYKSKIESIRVNLNTPDESVIPPAFAFT